MWNGLYEKKSSWYEYSLSQRLSSILAEWAFTSWGSYNPTSSIEGAKQKFIEHVNNNSLPLTLIALVGKKPVGMCSLRSNDGIRPELAPWLGSLYVDSEYRSRGIVAELIKITIQKAKHMRYTNLYL